MAISMRLQPHLTPQGFNLYADETLWIEQGKPIGQGLFGPRALFEFATANEGKVARTIDHLFVSDDETLAVMIGAVEAVVESADMDATGTYLLVLDPDDDGWEIVTDMWHQQPTLVLCFTILV